MSFARLLSSAVRAQQRSRNFSVQHSRVLRESKAVEVAQPVAAAAPAPAAVEPPKSTSSVRGRFMAFMFGIASSAIAFTFVLREDVLQNSAELRRTIDALHSDVILQENDLKARVKALEKTVAELQAASSKGAAVKK